MFPVSRAIMANDITSSKYIGYRLEIFIGVLVPVQIALVVLRFYARALTAVKYGADDWLVVISLLGQLVASGLAIAVLTGSVRQGAVGYHVGYLEKTNPSAVTLFFKYLVAISAWYYVTISISKLAICVLYHRLFPTRPIRIVLYVTASIMICTVIASLAADLAACAPFEANWAPPEVQATQCIDKEALFIWSTFPNIVTDIILLTIPIPVVWKLNASRQLKMALTVTFLISSIGLVASVLRFVAFSNTNSFVDATYNAVELIIWTVAEPGIYLVSACIVMYRPLLEKFHIGPLSGMSARRSMGILPVRYGVEDSRRSRRTLEVGGEITIALRSKTSSGGFEQLLDPSDDGSVRGHTRSSQTSVVAARTKTPVPFLNV
ncbi:hypothetical protein F4810DRAFT_30201 [Camillea tinctor]|nr:hypothetical protein F4810DRAFT_30201 [Camillea tinctor]